MEYRPWRAGDETLVATAEMFLSPRSLNDRFFVGTGGRLPAAYVRHIAGGPRTTWDAHVVVAGGTLLGWAEYGRRPGRLDEADLGVIVVDPWQRQGIGTALVQDLLPRAYRAGVRRLNADVLPGNTAAHAMLAKALGPGLDHSFSEGVVHYEIDLGRFAPGVDVARATVGALAPAGSR